MSKFTETVERNCKGLKGINSGSAACCSICLDKLGIEDTGDIDVMQYQIEYLDEPYFAWCQCDTCGSWAGGNRSNGHGFDENDEVVHLSMCTDCVIFFANGEEPESWD